MARRAVAVVRSRDGEHRGGDGGGRGERGNAVETAGLDDFPFHGCRHHFASWFMMRGGQLEALREILGHKGITMTLRYAHLSPGHLRTEIEKTAGVSTSLAHDAKIEPAPEVSARNAGVAQWQSN